MNLIALTDSYKFSHFNQFPSDAQYLHYYFECRSDREYQEVYFYGLRYYLNMLAEGHSWPNIGHIRDVAKLHGLPFNFDGWWSLMDKHRGSMPLEIKAAPENQVYPVKNVLFTVENTDPEFPWLAGWFETLLMKVWYPISVATKSYHVKQMLLEHWEETSDNLSGVDFAYHNFGDRGSSSVESALIGGLAHLQLFKGTDNFNAVYEGLPNTKGFSIPATEHSTVTSHGKFNEFIFYQRYLELYKHCNIIACVMDSYDIYDAVRFVTSGDMKVKIESDYYPTWVIRPDSGDFREVIPKILRIMEDNKVKYTFNSKGYKVFNKYRIIWGDGITPQNINSILVTAKHHGYSAENFAFGSGGDLMQNCSRDTLGCAIKCSNMETPRGNFDVFKSPLHDSGKASRKGRQTLVKREGKYLTIPLEQVIPTDEVVLKTVFKDGVINV